MSDQSDPVLTMLSEYYRDLFESNATPVKAEEVVHINWRVLVGRYFTRVLNQPDAGRVFFCQGYQSPHFWCSRQTDEAMSAFITRCTEHPERRATKNG